MKKHQFTLLEIMVAAAVLVIMMSFIFQFTSSAQKLWKTNAGRNEMSEAMDVVFDLLNDDFENMYIVSPQQDLDAQAGWYCMHKKSGSADYPFANVKGYNLEDLCFFTMDKDGNKVYPVRYHFKPATDPDDSSIGAGKLYRFENKGNTWDKIADEFKKNVRGGNPDWYVPLEKYTASDEIPKGYSVGDIKWPVYDEENLIAENLQSVQIFSSAAVDPVTGIKIDASKMPLMDIPQGITVTLVMSVPKNLRGNEKKVIEGDEVVKATDRAMTRVYMLR